MPSSHLSPLFAAVQAREINLVRLFLSNGADPNERTELEHIPVLGFAIFDAARDPRETVDIVAMLLASGADVHCIPKYMWTEYVPAALGKFEAMLQKPLLNEAAQWCCTRSGYEPLLASQLHITHRYFLKKASELQDTSLRRVQVSKMHEMLPLLELPYHMIGQERATRKVIDKMISHIASSKDKPLVMVFAGLSGHGKTELARQMGKYLSAEHILIDCTEMKHETDLFGPKAPYIDSEGLAVK